MMEAARDSISPRTRATSVIPTSTSWFILVEPEFRDTADAARGHMARLGPARGRSAEPQASARAERRATGQHAGGPQGLTAWVGVRNGAGGACELTFGLWRLWAVGGPGGQPRTWP